MEHEGLTPCVKNGQDAHARTKPRGAEVEQGLARASKQDCVDDLGRVQSQDIENRRDREDDVKVRDVEDFITARVEPLLASFSTAAGTVTVTA
jgi:alkylated DNA repair dioxygenase AlkB